MNNTRFYYLHNLNQPYDNKLSNFKTFDNDMAWYKL